MISSKKQHSVGGTVMPMMDTWNTSKAFVVLSIGICLCIPLDSPKARNTRLACERPCLGVKKPKPGTLGLIASGPGLAGQKTEGSKARNVGQQCLRAAPARGQKPQAKPKQGKPLDPPSHPPPGCQHRSGGTHDFLRKQHFVGSRNKESSWTHQVTPPPCLPTTLCRNT